MDDRGQTGPRGVIQGPALPLLPSVPLPQLRIASLTSGLGPDPHVAEPQLRAHGQELLGVDRAGLVLVQTLEEVRDVGPGDVRQDLALVHLRDEVLNLPLRDAVLAALCQLLEGEAQALPAVAEVGLHAGAQGVLVVVVDDSQAEVTEQEHDHQVEGHPEQARGAVLGVGGTQCFSVSDPQRGRAPVQSSNSIANSHA